MTLGEKLKKARKEANLTARDLAELTGVAKSTIYWYEKDLVEPSFFKLCLIANVLKISLNYLAGYERREDNDE